MRMSCEGLPMLPCLYIPETHGLVPTPTREQTSIRTERNTLYFSCMPSEGLPMLSCLYTPEMNYVALTSTCEQTSIQTERDAVDRVRMPFNREMRHMFSENIGQKQGENKNQNQGCFHRKFLLLRFKTK